MKIKIIKKTIATVIILTSFIAIFPLQKVKAAETEWSWDYTGHVETWTAPRDGKYYIETQGGMGGMVGESGSGPRGGFFSGITELKAGDTLYIAVGGLGTSTANGAQGGWNGGGSTTTVAPSGGGATSIYTKLYGDGQLVNYADHKEDILTVAGGGGGAYWVPNIDQMVGYKEGNYFDMFGLSPVVYFDNHWPMIASHYTLTNNSSASTGGGGTDGRGSLLTDNSMSTTTCVAGYDTGGKQTTGYAFGKGQDGNTTYNYGYAGGGGGGYYGGFTVDTSSVQARGGGGGSGYYKPNTFTNMVMLNGSGYSRAVIKYVATMSSLTINMNKSASYNGSDTMVTIFGDVGDTFDLSQIQLKEGYELYDLKLTLGNISALQNKIFTFDGKNSVVDIISSTKLVGTTELKDDILKIGANQKDSIDKNFTLLQSIDGSPFTEVSSASMNYTRINPIDFAFTGNVQPYIIPESGYYKLDCYGAGNQNQYKWMFPGIHGSNSQSYRYYGLSGFGGMGSYATGTTYLEKGDILYIYVGGQNNSFNGGGQNSSTSKYFSHDGYPSITLTTEGFTSKGSGATDIRVIKASDNNWYDINHTNWNTDKSLLSRLITAGGGGGASYTVRHYNLFVSDTGAISYGQHNGQFGAYDAREEGTNGQMGLGSSSIHGNNESYWYTNIFEVQLGSTGGGGGGWYGGKTTNEGPIQWYNGTNCIGLFMHSYAGTSHIYDFYNNESKTYYLEDAEVLQRNNPGNGKAQISFLGNFGKNDFDANILLKDLAAPNAPKGAITFLQNSIEIQLDDTKDNGTNYKYKLYSKEDITEKELGYYGIIDQTYTSGLKGYYYYIDTKSTGTANTTNSFTTNDLIQYNTDFLVKRYIHIAAIDNAGNLSKTIDICIPNGDVDDPEINLSYQIINDDINPIEELALEEKDLPKQGDVYIPGTWTSQSVKVIADVSDLFSDVQEFQWDIFIDPSNATYAIDSGKTESKTIAKDHKNHRIGSLLCNPQKLSYGSYYGKITAKDSAASFNGSGNDHVTINDFANINNKILIDRIKPTAFLTFHTNGLFTGEENISEDFTLEEWNTAMENNYWTNQPVTITVNASDQNSGLHPQCISWDNGKTWGTKTSITVENITSDFCLIRDVVGNMTRIPYIVGNIDTQNPKRITTIETDIPKDWVNKDIQINLLSQDYESTVPSQKASGIYSMTLYKADETFNKMEQVEKTTNPRDGEPAPLTLQYLNQIQGITYWVCDIYDNAGNQTEIQLINKLDKTSPQIMEPVENNIYVHQTSLDEFSEKEILEAIKGDIFCYFNYYSSDYSKLENGELTQDDGTDSSGIAKATLRLINADNIFQYVDITEDVVTTGLPGITLGYVPGVISYTNEPDSPPNFTKGNLTLQLSAMINTYEAFPDWAAICWEFTIEDRAGNKSVIYQNIDGEEIKNFSVKTVIHSDESNEFNILETSGINKGNTTAYFRTGELGHTETWTVGYVPEIKTDFGSIGIEMTNEIKNSKILKKYGIGDNSAEFQRLYKPYTAGEAIESGRPDKNGIPYATYYNKSGYWNYTSKYSNGTQIRIPPYYQLQSDGTKRSDGRKNYEWETHTYDAIAEKNGWTDKAQGMYVIWDTKTDEIHYRITHES